MTVSPANSVSLTAAHPVPVAAPTYQLAKRQQQQQPGIASAGRDVYADLNGWHLFLKARPTSMMDAGRTDTHLQSATGPKKVCLPHIMRRI